MCFLFKFYRLVATEAPPSLHCSPSFRICYIHHLSPVFFLLTANAGRATKILGHIKLSYSQMGWVELTLFPRSEVSDIKTIIFMYIWTDNINVHIIQPSLSSIFSFSPFKKIIIAFVSHKDRFYFQVCDLERKGTHVNFRSHCIFQYCFLCLCL